MQTNNEIMRSLKEIKKKKILIVCAHPDDETLWFFQSTQELQANNEVMILCMTHAAVSKRGKELQDVAMKYNLKVIFGHCEDTGINQLLHESEVKMALIKTFSKYKFDLVLTHPPHGGEKPHPHHIQIYKAVKRFSQYHLSTFGFFSERKIMSSVGSKCKYFFKDRKYILRQIFYSSKLIQNDVDSFSRWYFLLILFKDILFESALHLGFETTVNLEEKKKALLSFESQESVLKNYKTFCGETEYLFVVNFNSAKQGFWGFHHFISSTNVFMS